MNFLKKPFKKRSSKNRTQLPSIQPTEEGHVGTAVAAATTAAATTPVATDATSTTPNVAEAVTVAEAGVKDDDQNPTTEQVETRHAAANTPPTYIGTDIIEPATTSPNTKGSNSNSNNSSDGSSSLPDAGSYLAKETSFESFLPDEKETSFESFLPDEKDKDNDNDDNNNNDPKKWNETYNDSLDSQNFTLNLAPASSEMFLQADRDSEEAENNDNDNDGDDNDNDNDNDHGISPFFQAENWASDSSSSSSSTANMANPAYNMNISSETEETEKVDDDDDDNDDDDDDDDDDNQTDVNGVKPLYWKNSIFHDDANATTNKPGDGDGNNNDNNDNNNELEHELFRDHPDVKDDNLIISPRSTNHNSKIIHNDNDHDAVHGDHIHGDKEKADELFGDNPMLSNIIEFQENDDDNETIFSLTTSKISLFKDNDPNYQPISGWIGRLILNNDSSSLDHRNGNSNTIHAGTGTGTGTGKNTSHIRTPGKDDGVSIELEHAPVPYQHLIGRILPLRWSLNEYNNIHREMRDYVNLTTRDVNLTEDGRKILEQNEFLQPPSRLYGLKGVGPLESLAGSRAEDNVHVILPSDGVFVGNTSPPRTIAFNLEDDEEEETSEEEEMEPRQQQKGDPVISILKDKDDKNQADTNNDLPPTIYLQDHPVQVSGVYYCVVTVVKRIKKDYFQVRHYNSKTKDFSGSTSIVRYPHAKQLFFSKDDTAYPSTNINIENSPENVSGWYFYGSFIETKEKDLFIVESIEPFRALSLEPVRLIQGQVSRSGHQPPQRSKSFYKEAFQFIKSRNFAHLNDRMGTVRTTLIDLETQHCDDAVSLWKEGDRMIVMHNARGVKSFTYNQDLKEEFGAGHLLYGYASIVRDGLTKELRFDIDYIQVGGTSTHGVISGAIKRQCFLGNLHTGYLGLRPVSDCLVKLDTVSNNVQIGSKFSICPWKEIKTQIHIMAARYRVGDGDGVVDVRSNTRCLQDSNQSLYVAIDKCENVIQWKHKKIKDKYESNWNFKKQVMCSDSVTQFHRLKTLGAQLHSKLAPRGMLRSDWRHNSRSMANSKRLKRRSRGSSILSYNKPTLPRHSYQTTLRIFLQNDAKLWFITTSFVGGENENVVPL